MMMATPGPIRATLSAALSPVIDLIYPPRCLACGALLAAQSGLCVGCWQGLAFPGKPACRLCQVPFFDAIPHDGCCPLCAAHPPAHDGIAAATLYNPTARTLVLGLKHARRLALVPLLARLIAARLEGVAEGWLLVPVPLHRWRLWRRGFNQSALIAAELARLTGARLVVDALVRQRATPSLGGLGRAARQAVLAGAITVNPRRAGLLAGARVVLVDDVLTSGATSDACIAALHGAGAVRVRIACFARVINAATVE